VQGTGHTVSVDDSLAQRTALVGTLIPQRKDLVIECSKDADIPEWGLHDSGTLSWYFIERANFNPIIHLAVIPFLLQCELLENIIN